MFGFVADILTYETYSLLFHRLSLTSLSQLGDVDPLPHLRIVQGAAQLRPGPASTMAHVLDHPLTRPRC